MLATAKPQPLSIGRSPAGAAGEIGSMRASHDLLLDPSGLSARLAEDGYLYLPGVLDRDAVAAARADILARLVKEFPGVLDDDRITCAASTEARLALRSLRPEFAMGNPAIERIVFGDTMRSLFEGIFGEPARHFDFIWLRPMAPGRGTEPHCDWVYMGRGSPQLLTCWTPYGDYDLQTGGLMLLEGSHREADRLRYYLATDVDRYCENRSEERQRVAVEGKWAHRGWLTDRPDLLPGRLGSRWLSAPEWRMGDVVIFNMTMIHGSLDNQSNRVRISSDTRWQPAAHAIDPRWVGEDPPGHGLAGKMGRIC